MKKLLIYCLQIAKKMLNSPCLYIVGNVRQSGNRKDG